MVTLRVRMADGAVKRLQATPDDTVHALVDKLGMTDENLGLGTDATGDAVVPTASVASLRLRNGDFLYVKVRFWHKKVEDIIAALALCKFYIGHRFQMRFLASSFSNHQQ